MKQRTKFDCGIVALAKLMEESYEYVNDFAFNAESIGLSSIEMISILSVNHFNFKYSCSELYFKNAGCESPYLRCHLNQSGMNTFIGDNRAVVIEQKESGAIHALYFNGRKYFDPSIGEYLDEYYPDIVEAIVIKDD